jgi:hypothetical protein
MKEKDMRKAVTMMVLLTLLAGLAQAGEVDKGKIPADHVAKSLKALPWGAQIWDVEEAVAGFKAKDQKILWVDTRPSSFFSQGTLRDAVLLVYDKTGASYPDGEPVCTKETLEAAVAAAGADVVVFFCQGPKCHRSYNAAYVAVTEWGYDPAKVVWFRDGYPNLFKAVGEDAKLKRRAKKYLCDASLGKI